MGTNGQHVAYISVSSYDQNLERQLVNTGIEFDETFKEKAPAKDVQRPQL